MLSFLLGFYLGGLAGPLMRLREQTELLSLLAVLKLFIWPLYVLLEAYSVSRPAVMATVGYIKFVWCQFSTLDRFNKKKPRLK